MQDNEIFRSLADNPLLLSALRNLLEAKLSVDTLDHSQSVEMLGQMVKARLVGMAAINDAFKEIEQYRTTPPAPERINRAR